jgi:hypothetical protein
MFVNNISPINRLGNNNKQKKIAKPSSSQSLTLCLGEREKRNLSMLTK